MNKQFRILLLSALCMCMILPATAREKMEKVISKSFNASAGHTLSVENRYGNINVSTWNKNEISFEITIKVEAKSRNDAERLLNEINIDFRESGKTISAVTNIGGNCNNCSRTIHYQIMVPKGIHYSIENRYGNVTIPDVQGNTDFTVKYGNLTTGDLSGSNNIDVSYGNFKSGSVNGTKNYIDVKYGDINMANLMGNSNTITTSYGSKVQVKQTSKMNINIKYSKLRIDIADELKVESGYTNTEIGKVKKLTATSKYENYDIDEVDELNASFSYTNVTIAKLGKTLNVSDIKYGKLGIGYVLPDFQSIDIDARHTDVKIGMYPKASYNLDLYTRHANIKVPSEISSQLNTSEPERYSKSVRGTVGSNPGKAKIKVTNNYGDITIR